MRFVKPTISRAAGHVQSDHQVTVILIVMEAYLGSTAAGAKVKVSQKLHSMPYDLAAAVRWLPDMSRYGACTDMGPPRACGEARITFGTWHGVVMLRMKQHAAASFVCSFG